MRGAENSAHTGLFTDNSLEETTMRDCGPRRWGRCLAIVVLCGLGVSLVPRADDTQPVRGAYLRGCYAMQPANQPLPREVLINPGFVGIYLQFVWSDVEVGENTFDFSRLDARIAEARQANLKVVLSIRADLTHIPRWLAQDSRVERIRLVATNPHLKTYHRWLSLPLFWDPIYHEAKKRFILALGRRYADDPAIIAVTAAFANMDTDDWGVPHENRKTLLNQHGVDFDNEQEWLRRGYSTEVMLRIGREIIDTTTAAFPRQALKLPLGIHGKTLNGFGQVDAILRYGYGRYGRRFYAQVNRLDTSIPEAGDPILDASGPYERYFLFKVLRSYSPAIGIQMIGAASLGNRDHCRQNHGRSPCPPFDVLRQSIAIALSYRPTFLEFWPEDAANRELAPLFLEATRRMGGKPRGLD
jgi:Beta-galactosidase